VTRVPAFAVEPGKLGAKVLNHAGARVCEGQGEALLWFRLWRGFKCEGHAGEIASDQVRCQKAALCSASIVRRLGQ
jgi:hypothetical protein